MGLKKRTESQIVTACCAYLATNGYKVWRQNNVGVYDPTRKAHRRQPRHCINGVPDIFCLDGEYTWGLEVKTATGKQSRAQKEFEQFWTDNGMSWTRQYAIIRSTDDLVALGFVRK